MIALVPMRSGSKGIPHKNIRDFCGEPLFLWNIGALIEAGANVWVSTDSLKYEQLLNNTFNSNVNVFMRSERTSRDDAVTVEVVQEFIEKLDLNNNDIFLLSQVTSPYLKSADVGRAIDMIKHGISKDGRKIDSVVSCGKIKRYLWHDDGTNMNFHGDRKPRQKWEGTAIQNGCLYCTTVGNVRKHASLWGGNVELLFQDHWFELDENPDWEYGEAEMREILNGN